MVHAPWQGSITFGSKKWGMYLFNKTTVAKILCRDAGTEGNNRCVFTDCFFLTLLRLWRSWLRNGSYRLEMVLPVTLVFIEISSRSDLFS